MTTTHPAPVATTSALFDHAAPPEEAVHHFRARLGFETDVSDVAAALAAREPGFVLVDTRSEAAWAAGRIPGAVHLPGRRIADDAAARIPAGTPVVVYCWGPGCNGATRAALAFAMLGHPVKEMLGGFEYWAREGFEVERDGGTERHPLDTLTNVATDGPPIECAC
ncbi:rhodanese-like domain-containing protein [Agromyces sp. NPDC056523]|uniref:rhodanese-like domain-containing protein n=1 Tax=Agromyces sp. NPDC056523 TaxID=3345850 RepID=UPI0036716994